MTLANTERPSYTLDLIPGKQIALFHWQGPITIDDRQLSAQRMADFCHAHNVNRIIVDTRDLESDFDVVESYDFGKSVPVAMHGLIIAVVVPFDDELEQLIETVAFNRGGSTRSFTDLRSAQAWLESLG